MVKKTTTTKNKFRAFLKGRPTEKKILKNMTVQTFCL